MSGTKTVESVHPLLLVYAGTVRGHAEFWTKVREAEDFEDLDALPVVEQAAIVCGAQASDYAARVMRPVFESFDTAVSEAANAACRKAHGLFFVNGIDIRDEMSLEWAEAEARIRTGEVAP